VAESDQDDGFELQTFAAVDPVSSADSADCSLVERRPVLRSEPLVQENFSNDILRNTRRSRWARSCAVARGATGWYSANVSLTITIPDEFAEVLGSSDEERAQRAREGLALDLYREGKISLRRMGELAGVGGDYWAAENFRVLHKAPLNYSCEDLEADRQAAERFLQP
jgi:predicted HTH domain antitoxin